MKQRGWWQQIAADRFKSAARLQKRTRAGDGDSLEDLSAELSTLLSAPRPANEFATDLWARIEQAQSARQALPQAGFTLFHWAAAGMTGTAIILLIYGFHFGRQPLSTARVAFSVPAESQRIAADSSSLRETQTASYSTRAVSASSVLSWYKPKGKPAETRQAALSTASASALPSVRSPQSALSLRKSGQHRAAFHRPAKAARTLLAAQAGRKRSTRQLAFRSDQGKSNMAQSDQVKDWKRIGSQCEVNADYAGAAHAYRQAYKGEPDPNVAFVAGRMAEASGETSQALEDYTNVLRADVAVRKQGEVSVD